jgi:VWFA-related protein
MRLLTVASLVAVTVATASAFQQPTFKSGAKTVAVYATVTDKDGRLVPDLVQEDFEIRDSGKTQPIAVFSNEVQPISVVIMLDRSGSMRGNYRLVEAAGEAFVRAMLPADRARIGSFAEKVQIDPETFISDKKELINILRTKLQNDGPTPLWNAIDASIATLKDQEGRKVVLAFTDGADNPSIGFNNKSFMDIMRRGQVADVMVYAVGLESTGAAAPSGGSFGGPGGGFGGSRPDPGLPAIAEETGGGYFELRRAPDLADTFARVADELHRQYLIGFVPEKLDGKMHKIEVKVKKPGMKVRARKEYFAAK